MKRFCIVILLVGSASFARSNAATIELSWVLSDGTTEREVRTLAEDAGVYRFAIPRSELAAKDARRLDLTPDFAHARNGEDGFWLSPDGRCGEFVCDSGRFENAKPAMSMYGMKTPRMAFAAIVTGLKYYWSLSVEARDGEYSMRCRLDEELCRRPYEDFSIEFHALDGDRATYSGMANAYRDHQLSSGAVKPLKERAADNEVLRDAIAAPEIRVRQAWKPVPSPIPDQQPENEPPVKPVVTFDRVADIARECKAQGIGKAEFCLVGWNVGGHDGRYPQLFPVEPSLGGEKRLRALIDDVKSLGYKIVPHGNFCDAYLIADSWDGEWTVKGDDGAIKPHQNMCWGGGRPYEICPMRAYEKFAVKDMARMKALGFAGIGYFDVVTIIKAPECMDVRHPCTRADSARYWGMCAECARRHFGGFASEGGIDHMAGQTDYVLYAFFGDPRKAVKGLVTRMVPVWQLVYNGIIASNPFTTTVNYTAQDAYSRLKVVECGGRPAFYFNSKFLSTGRDWMGDGDLRCGTDEELKASVAKISQGWRDYERLSHLQFEFMTSHGEVAPGVFMTSYANGESVYVNYNDEDVRVSGAVIPAQGWIVE